MNEDEYYKEIPVITEYHWEYDDETNRVFISTKLYNVRLDEEESSVFIHIVNNSTVRDIVRNSGISQENVVSILKDFEDKGIISYRSRVPLIWEGEDGLSSMEREVNIVDVLLINPPLSGISRGDSSEDTNSSFPPGILCLIKWLVQHDYEVDALDLGADRMKKSEFLALLEKGKPRMVGISVVTERYVPAVEVARAVKEWNPETIVIFGGPHVSVMDEEAMHTGVVDIVVRGEGEMTLLELAETLLQNRGRPLHQIAGITYSADDRIHRTPDRPFPRNLDAHPFPIMNPPDLEKYGTSALLISSRGCPGRCVFCAARSLSGYAYRTRSAEHVVAEMRFLCYVLGYKMIGILDDTMVALPSRMIRICQYLIDSHFDASWSGDARADTVTPELLDLMAKAGCFFIHYGMESGDQSVLDSIRKGITVEQIRSAVKWTCEAGIFVKISAMIGHHTDTKESILRTIEFLKELAHYHVVATTSISTPYPGTYLYEHADELGVTILSKNWEDYTLLTPVLETKYLSRIDIKNSYQILRNVSMDTWKYANEWKEKARSLFKGGQKMPISTLKEGQYIVLTTRGNLTYAGEFIQETVVNGKKGIVVALGKGCKLAIWCDFDNIKDIFDGLGTG